VRALFAGLGVVALVAAGCGDTRSRRLESAGISVDLPRGWHGRISKSEQPVRGAAVLVAANGRLRARVVLSETLAGYDAPAEPARIDPHERRASVDRFVSKSGRSFWLHAELGPNRSVRAVNVVLGSLTVEPRTHPLKAAPDPAPPRALRAPELVRTPPSVLAQCRRAQARSRVTLLCPRRLTKPFIGKRLRLSASMLPAPGATWTSRSDPRYRNRRAGGLTIGYGGPWEPDSAPDWRGHLWRNRPCCFLHFEIFWRRAGPRQVPAGARPAVLGGHRGLLKDASSYGLASATGDYMYFPNHTRFLWRENGVDYVASLHRFGSLQETRALLNRLIRELRPVGDL
jgi:hypothetical protein